MGMYTEFYLKVPLKKDVPNDILSALEFLTSGSWSTWYKSKDFAHPFFNTDYFLGCVNVTFEWPGDNRCIITNHSEFKNYHDEIKLFCDWLAPYVDATWFITEGFLFVGWYLYEADPNPTLIYFTDEQEFTFVPITYEYYRENNHA